MNIPRYERICEGGRNRGELHGVVIHDFVPRRDDLSVHQVARYARDGGRGIPGPLYHYLVDHSGHILQIAEEHIKTNNAGRCRRDALEAMRLPGSYHGDGNLPIVSTSTRTKSGNYHTISISMVRTGKQPVTSAMWHSLVRLCRDIKARHEPFDHRSFVGHRELAPTRKVDPNNVSMVELRNAIVGIGVADKLAPHGEPNNFPILAIGVESSHVEEVQRRLHHSFLLHARDIDGVYGERTAHAVRCYQAVSWLQITGEVDQATWVALTPPSERERLGLSA